MTAFLGGLESQPRFPHEDLTDDNANMLAVMLANHEFAQFIHTESEIMVPAFRVIHPAVFEGAIHALPEEQHAKALSYGAAVFEAMSLLVQSFPDSDKSNLAIIATAFAHPRGPINTVDYILAAEDELRASMPRTAEVVSVVSRRIYSHLYSYAVAGAALTRKMEIDAGVPAETVE